MDVQHLAPPSLNQERGQQSHVTCETYDLYVRSAQHGIDCAFMGGTILAKLPMVYRLGPNSGAASDG